MVTDSKLSAICQCEIQIVEKSKEDGKIYDMRYSLQDRVTLHQLQKNPMNIQITDFIFLLGKKTQSTRNIEHWDAVMVVPQTLNPKNLLPFKLEPAQLLTS